MMMPIVSSCYSENAYRFYLAGRYVAPEVFKKEEYDTKVDVFSFALIFQEVRIYLFFALLYFM